MSTRASKFTGTIAYQKQPVAGVPIYSQAAPTRESLEDLLEKFAKEDITSAKAEELVNKIKARAAEARSKWQGLEGGTGERAARRFTIIGNKPVPDPEGEYTFSEALRTCALNAGEKAGVGQEKMSEIIQALAPFIKKETGETRESEQEKQENTVLNTALDILKERANAGQGNQPLTFNDLFTFFEKMQQFSKPAQGETGQPPSFLEQMQQFVGVYQTMQGMFGGGQKEEGGPPVYINLKGENGQEGSLPFDTFVKWDEHRFNRRQKEEEHESKMKTAEQVRNFLGMFGKAATRRAGTPEQ